MAVLYFDDPVTLTTTTCGKCGEPVPVLTEASAQMIAKYGQPLCAECRAFAAGRLVEKRTAEWANLEY
jgi:hypothetical protein